MRNDPLAAATFLVQEMVKAGYDYEDFGYASREEAFEDIYLLWEKCKMAISESPISFAMHAANRKPLQFDSERAKSLRNYNRFLNLAYYMYTLTFPKPCGLPTESLGPILGVSPKRVSDFRNMGVKDGYLELRAKHHFGPGGGRATCYAFHTNRQK
jgi:hypothetical protein